MSDTDCSALGRDVHAWLAEHWTADVRSAQHNAAQRTAWLRKVVDARWAVPRWPTAWFGRALGDEQAKIIEAAFDAAGAPGAGQDRSNIAANTLLQFGSEQLKRQALADLLTESSRMCLLYSEPGAGSDLASLRTRADRCDGGWRVSGQKVWTSGAQEADFGLLLARTDWTVPKHRGISFFFLPMKQPGIEVRPIRQITGDCHFNEVFIDDAFVPEANLLGEENQGWQVLQTALAVERLIMGEGIGERRFGSTEDNNVDLIALARDAGCLDDPCIRQDIAKAIAFRQLNTLNLARAKLDATTGESAALMSLGKLAMSRILHEDARVMTAILQAASILDGADYPVSSDVNYRTANAYMTSIGGGTDQIQRNIIAERILGLPREVELDRGVAFQTALASRP
jgi:alkylation response protein AidB-like acyl-CoA dehydrogenase